MRIPLLLALAAFAMSCRRSPAAKAEEAKTELSSWDATLELLAQERAAGALPERFAEQVRRAAEEGRRKARMQLREARAP
jgi:hypothetical protein